MADDLAPQTTEAPRCQWCSAVLPSDNLATCPSCGATLTGDADPALPGITALDAEAIIRAARAPAAPKRNRLLSWISGEYQDNEETPAPPGSLELPSEDVRREMLRLELEAEVAELQAEAESIVAEAEVEAREEGWIPPEEGGAGPDNETGPDAVAAEGPAVGENPDAAAAEEQGQRPEPGAGDERGERDDRPSS
jgi:hypothetical protein